MFAEIVTFIVDTVSQLGYLGIIFLMFLESSFLSFPSEVVMIPAGYLAFQGEMNMTLVIIMGTIGSILGALLNYYLALTLGRPLLAKYGHWLFLPLEKLQKVETFFRDHGEVSTFIGRLIPVVRQYISFPAGLSHMQLFRFCLFTGLGAGLWVGILATIGYIVGQNQELVQKYTNQGIILALFFGGIVGIGYIILHTRKKRRLALAKETVPL